MGPALSLWLLLFAAQATAPATEPASNAPQTNASPSSPDTHPKATILPCSTDAKTPNVMGAPGLTPPTLTHKVDAVYSDAARKAKMAGVVLVNLWVDAKATRPTCTCCAVRAWD